MVLIASPSAQAHSGISTPSQGLHPLGSEHPRNSHSRPFLQGWAVISVCPTLGWENLALRPSDDLTPNDVATHRTHRYVPRPMTPRARAVLPCRFFFLVCVVLFQTASARAQIRVVTYNTAGDARAGIADILAG